jgi:hypothetical protein
MKILIFLTILLTTFQAIASEEVETIFNYADCTVGLSAGAILVKGEQRAKFEGEANRVRQKAYAYILGLKLKALRKDLMNYLSYMLRQLTVSGRYLRPQMVIER